MWFFEGRRGVLSVVEGRPLLPLKNHSPPPANPVNGACRQRAGGGAGEGVRSIRQEEKELFYAGL